MANNSFFIDNQWKSGTGSLLKSYNPVNNELLWQGKTCSAEQVNDAIQSAQKAFFSWSTISVNDRIGFLEKFKTILKNQKNEFAKIISQETGKPFWESKTEIDSMTSKIDVSIAAYTARTGESRKIFNGTELVVRHKPHGIMGVIGPFNFPGHLPNAHIIPALLAGNTVVYKPSELTPLVAEYTMHCWQLANLPEGVINCVIGGSEVGETLIANRNVNGILFTGSYATGKKIHEALAGQPERIAALEMGGNNPLVVSEVADINAAVLTTILSAYLSAGQRCTCARRLIVVENNETTHFLEHLATAIQKISVNAFDVSPEPFMGSVITLQVATKLLATQEVLINQGAKPIVKMQLLKPNTGLLTPALLDVTSIKNRQDTEIFGPLLQVIRVKSFEEALEEANNTAYGLAAGLLSKNPAEYEKFFATIQAGVINWNRPTTGASSTAPFGGIKHSGNLRPGGYYAADYCAYPIASMEVVQLKVPAEIPIGLEQVL